jgi:hypothetical protein
MSIFFNTTPRDGILKEQLDMIDMITIALDIGIMTGIVMLVAFGVTLRWDAPRRGPHRDSPYRVYEDTP